MENRTLKFYLFSLVMLLIFIGNQRLLAQCPNDNFFAFSDTLSSTEDFDDDYNYNIYPGQYAVANIVEGETYLIGTCLSYFGISDINMTLYSEEDGSLQGYNDNYCGDLPELIYTATFTGTLRILIDDFGCTAPEPNQAPSENPDQANEINGYHVEIMLLPSEYKLYDGVAIEDYVLKFLSTQDSVFMVLSDTYGEIDRDTILNTSEFTYTIDELEDRFYLLDVLCETTTWKVLFKNPNFEEFLD